MKSKINPRQVRIPTQVGYKFRFAYIQEVVEKDTEFG